MFLIKWPRTRVKKWWLWKKVQVGQETQRKNENKIRNTDVTD